MKKLLVVIAVALSGFVNGQDLGDLGFFYIKMDSIDRENQSRPVYKIGDNDEHIKPLIETLFFDISSSQILKQQPTLQNLYVEIQTSDGKHLKVKFTEWIDTIFDKILLSKYHIVEKYDVTIDNTFYEFQFFDENETYKRVIIFCFDNTFNNVDHNNLRYIEDMW
jgi:hypothetical protein